MRRTTRIVRFAPVGIVAVWIAAAVIGLPGCDDFNLFEALDSELLIIPAQAVLLTGDRLTFEADQGVPPYHFEITAGSGTIDETTGEFDAAPHGSADVEITVFDAAGKQAAASVSVADPFSVDPAEATIEESNTVTLTVSGGRPPYLFTIESPAVNTFAGGATELTTSGSSVIYQGDLQGLDTVRVEDTLGSMDSLLITVVAAGAPLYITPGFTQLEIGAEISFSVGGGDEPYTFTTLSGAVTPNPLLEPGTILYTAPGTSGLDTITVSDDNGDGVSSDITIVDKALRLIPSEKITLYVGNEFTFTAEGGVEPYIFSIDPADAGDAAIDPDTGLFTALAKNNTVIVLVADSGGGSDQCRVKVKN